MDFCHTSPGRVQGGTKDNTGSGVPQGRLLLASTRGKMTCHSREAQAKEGGVGTAEPARVPWTCACTLKQFSFLPYSLAVPWCCSWVDWKHDLAVISEGEGWLSLHISQGSSNHSPCTPVYFAWITYKEYIWATSKQSFPAQITGRRATAVGFPRQVVVTEATRTDRKLREIR